MPILEAVKGGHHDIVDHLVVLDSKSIFVQDIMGRHCLHMAAQSGHSDLIKHLVERYEMPPNDSSSPTTPLHWAAKEGQAGAVATLLSLGANASACDASNRHPITLAIGGQHVEATGVLIRHDPQKPFDLTVLPLARSSALKQLLADTFRTQWNMTLFLPGTH